ncbi:AIR carboxylase family protein, partial [Klebsiella pneumoniae]|uniref:AIR carboxylase family protein n=1 Tax=Klebsiella pneumoniae TaxID=573 RepID=UPI0035B3B5CA
PRGIPVGTLAIGKAGAANAGLLAAQILAQHDAELHQRLSAWRSIRPNWPLPSTHTCFMPHPADPDYPALHRFAPDARRSGA